MPPKNLPLAVMFFLSGFCGMIYQTAWLRLAYAQFGITTSVLSVVLSVFMAGLSLGSWAGGRWILSLTRRTKKSAIFFYALTECLIGLGGLAVPLLFSLGKLRLLGLGETDSGPYLFLSAVVILFSLLPPCFLMGATFPLAMQVIRIQNPSEEEGFSFLYLANVLGACGGTLATAFLLVELLGFKGTLIMAAGLNITVGTAAFIWSLPKVYLAASDPPEKNGFPLPEKENWITAFLFMTGLSSMGMEAAWVRNFTPVLGNEIYSFSRLLALYLFATAAGSWLYRRHAARNRVIPDLLLAGFLSLSVFLPILLNDPAWHHPGWAVLATLFPFCSALGYFTPRLIDLRSAGSPETGGRAYAWNIFGCVLGPLLVSYLLLPAVGARWTLILLAVPFTLFYLALNLKRAATPLQWIPLGLSLVFFFLCGSTTGSYEEGTSLPSSVRLGLWRDQTATVLYYHTGRYRGILINGIGAAFLTPVTKVMAHLPLALCPHPPRSALVICFGMGTTFRSLASWGLNVTAVELVPSVKKAFGLSFTDAGPLLADPRTRVVIDDGRRFLQRTTGKYDVITLDPMPPVEAAGSGLLYSEDFYGILKPRLALGGIVHQWIPGGEEKLQQAFIRSFIRAFPYVKAFKSYDHYGTHLIGSLEPISIPTVAGLMARMPPAAREDLLEWIDPKDLEGFLRTVLSGETAVGTLLGTDEEITVTDDRPFNEYYYLRRTLPGLFKY